MAIQEIIHNRRTEVAWLHSDPQGDAKERFTVRGFNVVQRSASELKDSAVLSGITAAVISFSDQKPLKIAADIEEHVGELLNYDCRVIIRTPAHFSRIVFNKCEELNIPIANMARHIKEDEMSRLLAPGSIPPFPCVIYSSYRDDVAEHWDSIANLIVENPSSSAPNSNLVIDGLTTELSSEETILLQRAFADCKDVHLFPLDGGKSQAKVFRACAELKGAVDGPWPQPYFVKLGTRNQIFKEYTIYRDHVDPYLPFHLGPHLISERCCLGHSFGVIVGDFVEESESMRRCAQRAVSAISCLFDRTLMGWHRHAKEVQKPLVPELEKFFPKKIDAGRITRAKEFGSVMELSDIHSLFNKFSSSSITVGKIHGDLHASNVMVRANDAILIDFLSFGDGPLLFDAATLEASFLIDSFSDREIDVVELIELISPLYLTSPLFSSIPPLNPKMDHSWFYSCVMQIRRYARQWECDKNKNQYAVVLALALLVKASKDADAPEPENSLRAASYFFAEQLLLNAVSP